MSSPPPTPTAFSDWLYRDDDVHSDTSMTWGVRSTHLNVADAIVLAAELHSKPPAVNGVSETGPSPFLRVHRRYLHRRDAAAPTLRERLLKIVSQRKRRTEDDREGGLSARLNSDEDGDDEGGEADDSAPSITHTEVDCRFTETVAFQAAFREHGQLTRPLTGDLRVIDVLLAVFLWLPIDQSVLLAVSAVCRGWRDAARCLPQWSVVPQLLSPNPGLRNYAAPAYVAAQGRDASPDAWLDTYDGVAVETRDDYMACMKLRTDAKAYARELPSKHVVSSVCLRLRLNVLATCFVMAAVTFATFLLDYEIGVSSLSWGADGADAKIGMICFALSIAACCLVTLLSKYLRRFFTPVTRHLRNSRRRGDLGFCLAAVIAVVMLGPLCGLLAARRRQAVLLAEHVITYSAAGCTTAPTVSGAVPRYVKMEAPFNWTVAPWVNMSAPPQPWWNQRRCTLPRAASPTWWADQYLSSYMPPFSILPSLAPWGSGQLCWSPFVANGTSYGNFIVLKPPTQWHESCAGVMVALEYEPLRTSFNSTIASLFSSQGSNMTEGFVSFRTPVASRYLSSEGDIAMGDAWYSSGSAASLWSTNGIPLIAAPTSPSPAQLTATWSGHLLTWGLVVMSLFVVTLFLYLIPCYRQRFNSVLCFLLLFMLLNPLWLVGWGWKCASQPDDSTCLMSHTSALALFGTGIVLCVIFVAILIWNWARR